MSYKVLARKYRPETFADLVGQDTMVRTLANAFRADRIAQAFIMTGIRGTGKTTAARIIAKGMNCIGRDGNGGPTTDPCGVCEHCVAVTEGRHIDVMEMDAASRTGVNDIREIIDTVAYKSVSARFKVYIIDEVHMLSTNAFNALLKTLEEPPSHVKFIFATTEIRKVPVTVLSRCQRFDLRRIDPDTMMSLLRRIATAENARISDEALSLIVRASEGSARDATSLLDQAIGHETGETTVEHVRAMIGLADRGRILDLIDMIFRGETAAALTEFGNQYHDGAEPVAVLRDLAEVTHWLSVIKLNPNSADNPAISPDEKTRGLEMSALLSMRVLTRMWQMLLKALEEVSIAPNPKMAVEMAIIRLTHVADLPSPEDLVKQISGQTISVLEKSQAVTSESNLVSAQSVDQMTTLSAHSHDNVQTDLSVTHRTQALSGSMTALAEEMHPELMMYPTFESIVNLIRADYDMQLTIEIEKYVKLVSYQPGRIEFEPSPSAPKDLAHRLGQKLKDLTGKRWIIAVTREGGGPTLDETRNEEHTKLVKFVNEHRMLKATYTAFPNASITAIRTTEQCESTVQSKAFSEGLEEHECDDE